MLKNCLKKNKERSSRNTKIPSALQGLLVCGCCGRSYYKRMYGRNGKKWASYNCHSQACKEIKWCGNPSVNQEYLDDLVWKEAIKLIEHPQLIEEEIQRRIDENPKKKEIEGREQEIEKEIKKIKHAQNKLLDAYQETECLEINELKVRIQKLRSQEKELKKELESLHAFSILNEKKANLHITIEEFRRQLVENANSLSVQQKQKILRSLIEEIIIMRGEITINHSISLNFDRNVNCVQVVLSHRKWSCTSICLGNLYDPWKVGDSMIHFVFPAGDLEDLLRQFLPYCSFVIPSMPTAFFASRL